MVSHSILQGHFPSPGVKPGSPALQAVSLPSEPPGKPKNNGIRVQCSDAHRQAGKSTIATGSLDTRNFGDFPGGPGVKTSPSNAGGAGLIPGWGVKIPLASWPKIQNMKQKKYCNKLDKDFKNSS